MTLVLVIAAIILEIVFVILGEANYYNYCLALSATVLFLIYAIFFGIGGTIAALEDHQKDEISKFERLQALFYVRIVFIIIHGIVCLCFVPKTPLGLSGLAWICLGAFIFCKRIYSVKTYSYPLTDEEYKLLSKKKTIEYFKKLYSFDRESITGLRMPKENKSFMEADGKYYEMNRDVDLFGAWVPLLLKDKKHEWIVIALEKDEKIIGMWLNKGSPEMVYPFLSVESLIDKCKEQSARALICFHNHPNSYAIASAQDVRSARLCAEKATANGVHWIDCVCAAGACKKYFEQYSPEQVPEKFLPEQLKVLYSNSRKPKITNYLLHKQMGFENCHPPIKAYFEQPPKNPRRQHSSIKRIASKTRRSKISFADFFRKFRIPIFILIGGIVIAFMTLVLQWI